MGEAVAKGQLVFVAPEECPQVTSRIRGARLQSDMESLEWVDRHHWLAAQGWMELGNSHEAMAEFLLISPDARETEPVLHLEWELLGGVKRWEEAVLVAQRMVESHPSNVTGWIHCSYGLHELGRTEDARDNLLRGLPRFPTNPVLPYNLACYEAQLGNLTSARKWLGVAFALPGAEELKQAARKDPDLAPLKGDWLV